LNSKVDEKYDAGSLFDLNQEMDENIENRKIDKIIGKVKTDVNINCPRCRSANINKNGKTKIRRQRYICKDCLKSFSERTDSPLWYSKKSIEQWLRYLVCIKEGFSLREAAIEIKINLTTSFHWRHKILSVIGTRIVDNKLSGIIEVDEFRIKETFKGIKSSDKKYNPIIESRNEKNKRLMWDDNFKNTISILSCKDTVGSILFKAVTKGKIKRDNLDEVLAPAIRNGKILGVTRNMNYIYFAKANKLKLCMVGVSQYTIKGIDIKRAKEQSKGFRKFLMIFKGIASKYVSYYINWYRICLEKKDTLIGLIRLFITGRRQIKVNEFKYISFDGSILKDIK
jgi:transposase-like protein